MVPRVHVPAPVSLVTGSAGGLGLAIARRLQERGDKVHVVWRSDPERGAALEEDFRGRIHRCDLARAEAAEALVERVLEIDGKIDHVVHSVGELRVGTLAETEPEDWRALFESNLLTAVHLADALREPMRETGGSWVFLACAGASRLKGRRRIAAYAALKSALLVYARSLALEEAPFGLRVNTISPGLVPHEDAHPDTLRAAEELELPMGRPGRPADVAEAAVWLSSAHASYAVGLDLEVAGGWPV